MWDDEIDPVLLPSLQVAHIRRRQWEMRLQANEIIRALNTSLSTGEGSRSSPPQPRRVSAEQMMAKMGTTWH